MSDFIETCSRTIDRLDRRNCLPPGEGYNSFKDFILPKVSTAAKRWQYYKNNAITSYTTEDIIVDTILLHLLPPFARFIGGLCQSFTVVHLDQKMASERLDSVRARSPVFTGSYHKYCSKNTDDEINLIDILVALAYNDLRIHRDAIHYHNAVMWHSVINVAMAKENKHDFSFHSQEIIKPFFDSPAKYISNSYVDCVSCPSNWPAVSSR